MPNIDRETIRQAAAECLDIAHSTTDPNAHMRLIFLAGKFLELVDGPEGESLTVLLDEFNRSQMQKK